MICDGYEMRSKYMAIKTVLGTLISKFSVAS